MELLGPQGLEEYCIIGAYADVPQMSKQKLTGTSWVLATEFGLLYMVL